MRPAPEVGATDHDCAEALMFVLHSSSAVCCCAMCMRCEPTLLGTSHPAAVFSNHLLKSGQCQMQSERRSSEVSRRSEPAGAEAAPPPPQLPPSGGQPGQQQQQHGRPDGGRMRNSAIMALIFNPSAGHFADRSLRSMLPEQCTMQMEGGCTLP